MAESKPTKTILTADRVNLIIATCAILISAASFYATFLQADSAEKQVRAMTLPLIQFSHGNYDSALNQNAVSFTLKNAGVGPAILKSVEFSYLEFKSDNIWGFIEACCASEYKVYQQQYEKFLAGEKRIEEGGIVTAPIAGTILSGQSEYEFLKLYSHESNSDFWNKLNKERWQLKIKVCYCSMLEDCYRTQEANVFHQVASCSS